MNHNAEMANLERQFLKTVKNHLYGRNITILMPTEPNRRQITMFEAFDLPWAVDSTCPTETWLAVEDYEIPTEDEAVQAPGEGHPEGGAET